MQLKYKHLINVLPLIAAAIVGFIIYQQWQQQINARPDYDNPNASPNHRSVTTSLFEKSPPTHHAQLVEVISGDTITVSFDGKAESIRLCGINAPDVTEHLGEKSKQYLQQLIQSANGKLIIWDLGRDRRNRIIAEVFISANNPKLPEEEKFLNAEIISVGLATHYQQYSGGCPNRDIIVQAEEMAKEKRQDIWAIDRKKLK